MEMIKKIMVYSCKYYTILFSKGIDWYTFTYKAKASTVSC